MKNSTTVTGLLTIQEINYGRISDADISREKTKLSASGNAFAKAVGLLKSSKGEIPETLKDEEKVSGSKTTKTFRFEIGIDQAPLVLTEFDSGHDEEAFQNKLNTLMAKQTELKVSDLQGRAKAEALQALQPFGFRAQTVQLTLMLPDGFEFKASRSIRSRKRHYLRLPSVASLKAQMGPNIKWEPTDVAEKLAKPTS